MTSEASTACAQIVRGRLLESGTGEPIRAGVVVLLEETNAEVHRVETGKDGGFELHAPAPGSYFVRGEALGYATKVDGILDLGEGGEITIAFYLRPEPLEMDPVGVTGERDPYEVLRRRWLGGQGFYRRLAEGFGDFLTPEEIDRRQPHDARTLFHSIPPVHITEMTQTTGYELPNGRPVLGEVVTLRHGSTPTVFIDGTQVWPPRQVACQVGLRSPRPGSRGLQKTKAWPFPIEEYVHMADILAVEVYSGPSETPPGYNMTGASCGVILIWTR